MTRSFFSSVLPLVLASSLGACGSHAEAPPPALPPPVQPLPPVVGPPPSPAPQTLYDRLGGQAGVAAIADSLSAKLLADARVKAFFVKSKDDLTRFKAMLAEQICALAHGGCTYAGRPMREAHAQMGIGDAQFDAFVEDLGATLEEKQVSQADASELFVALAPMKQDIVQPPKKEKGR